MIKNMYGANWHEDTVKYYLFVCTVLSGVIFHLYILAHPANIFLLEETGVP